MRPRRKKHISPGLSLKIHEALKRHAPAIPAFVVLNWMGKQLRYAVTEYTDADAIARTMVDRRHEEYLYVATPENVRLIVTQCEPALSLN